MRSCVTPVSDAADRKIVTLAGLGTPEKPHPLQTAYIEEQVPQCGYCINGWIMTAAALLAEKKKPTEAEIKQALDGLKCRCGTHVSILQGGQARRHDDGLREAHMTKMDKPSAFSRRALLKGAVVVSVGAPLGLDTLLSMNAAQAQGSKPPLMPDQLSSYIAINADGTVSAFFGKMDMGHGLFVAIGQMVAEELDVPFKAVTVVHGRHRDLGEPGRRLGLDRHPARRQADAHGGGGSAPRAGRDGGGKAQDAGRSADRRQRRGQCRLQPRQEDLLRAS